MDFKAIHYADLGTYEIRIKMVSGFPLFECFFNDGHIGSFDEFCRALFECGTHYSDNAQKDVPKDFAFNFKAETDKGVYCLEHLVYTVKNKYDNTERFKPTFDGKSIFEPLIHLVHNKFDIIALINICQNHYQSL
jgi:hypothetical protein